MSNNVYANQADELEEARGQKRAARVILEGLGGELDSVVVSVSESDDTETDLSHAIEDVIEGWIVSVGDTIRIVEVA